MRLSTRTTSIAAAAVCLLLAVTSCGSGDNRYTEAAVAATANSKLADINKDGKVVITVLSPGDLNDNGYYESFVLKAEAFAARQGWTVKKHGNIKPENAIAEARKYCAEDKPDLVALGASEIEAAIPAKNDKACNGAHWYVPSSQAVQEQPGVVISQDFTFESVIAAGYANGLLMRTKGYDKAGFISGPEVGFATDAAKAFVAGIRRVLPDVKYEAKFTGDLNDGPKAENAMKELIDGGAKAVYPYLGGGTDPAAKVGNASDVILSTPGTNRCESTEPRFDISVIFDPGEYFAAALKDFSEGNLTMGERRVWHIGVDVVPTVRLCNGTDEQNAQLAQFITDLGTGTINVDNEVKRLGQVDGIE